MPEPQPDAPQPVPPITPEPQPNEPKPNEPKPQAPPIEDERGPQVPVKLPGQPHAPERVGS
jgi:hypothetical protein